MDGFVICPSCKAQVPAGFGQCQFCQASLANVARPMQDKRGMFAYEDGHTQTYFGKPKWVEPAYIAVCIYFIIGGIVNIIKLWAVKGLGDFEWLKYSMTAILSIEILLGIALLARAEFVRGIVNFICGISIVLDLLSLPGALIGTASGIGGFFSFLLLLLDLLTNALMIYLIGETDRK
jgi:hypothetical protein